MSQDSKFVFSNEQSFLNVSLESLVIIGDDNYKHFVFLSTSKESDIIKIANSKYDFF